MAINKEGIIYICMYIRLIYLLLGDEVEVIILLSLNKPERGESELFSGEFSESSCSETKKLLNLPSIFAFVKYFNFSLVSNNDIL